MSSEPAARAGGASRIAFVAALDAECAPLNERAARGAPWLVVQSGPGGERARAAAERAIAAGVGAIVSFGLAGGLDVSAPPGTVVVPRRVLGGGGGPWLADAGLRDAFAPLAALFTVHEGDLVSVDRALETPAAKRAAAVASGAVAVDMESAAVAAAADRGGVPFAVVRVVVDGLADALPPGAERWIDERGNRRLGPALRAALDPRQWRPLATLARRYALAMRVLGGVAVALAQSGALTSRGAAVRG